MVEKQAVDGESPVEPNPKLDAEKMWQQEAAFQRQPPKPPHKDPEPLEGEEGA